MSKQLLLLFCLITSFSIAKAIGDDDDPVAAQKLKELKNAIWAKSETLVAKLLAQGAPVEDRINRSLLAQPLAVNLRLGTPAIEKLLVAHGASWDREYVNEIGIRGPARITIRDFRESYCSNKVFRNKKVAAE